MDKLDPKVLEAAIREAVENVLLKQMLFVPQDDLDRWIRRHNDVRDERDEALSLAEERGRYVAALREAVELVVDLPIALITPLRMRNLRQVFADTAKAAEQYQLVDDEHVVVPIEPTQERLERGLEGTAPAFRQRDIEIRREIYRITTAPTKPETSNGD